VRRRDRLLELVHRLRAALVGVHLGAVHRDWGEIEDLDRHVMRCKFLRGFQQSAVNRPHAQASCNSQYCQRSFHCVLACSFLFSADTQPDAYRFPAPESRLLNKSLANATSSALMACPMFG